MSELSPLQLGELDNWVQFYEKEYIYVGKLIGRYYTQDGSPTKDWYRYQKQLGEKDRIKAEQKKLEQQFPGCNSNWSEKTKGKVYCSEKRCDHACNVHVRMTGHVTCMYMYFPTLPF